jgi:iron complex outermembrane receptor protein
MSAWSVYWGVNYIGETDNSEHFGQDTIQDSSLNQVAFDLVAESVVYHTVSASYDFGNGLLVRVGMANLTDEAPPRLTRRQTDSEVDVLGKAAFYSQYDWFGRRAFLNLTMDF